MIILTEQKKLITWSTLIQQRTRLARTADWNPCRSFPYTERSKLQYRLLPTIRLTQRLMHFSLGQTSHELQSCRDFMTSRRSVQQRSPRNSHVLARRRVGCFALSDAQITPMLICYVTRVSCPKIKLN